MEEFVSLLPELNLSSRGTTSPDTFFFASEEEEDEEVAEEGRFVVVEGGDEERFPAWEEKEEDEDDFILLSSASKAGARDLTTASRSVWCDSDWAAGGTKTRRGSGKMAAFFWHWESLSGCQVQILNRCIKRLGV